MSVLFQKLSEKYTSIRTINVFSDEATSQFKQWYLFSNLPGWENSGANNSQSLDISNHFYVAVRHLKMKIQAVFSL